MLFSKNRKNEEKKNIPYFSILSEDYQTTLVPRNLLETPTSLLWSTGTFAAWITTLGKLPLSALNKPPQFSRDTPIVAPIKSCRLFIGSALLHALGATC